MLQQTVGWPGEEAVAALCWVTAGTTGVSAATYCFLSADVFVVKPKQTPPPPPPPPR